MTQNDRETESTPVVENIDSTHRIRNGFREGIVVRIILVAYFVAIFSFGYWYWTHPVRPDQIDNAHTKWLEVAEIYKLPVPENKQWLR